jgi:cytochrome P450
MRATRWGYILRHVSGTLPFDILAMHKRYGPVVRIAPDELAFSDPRAWKDIMGHRGGGEGTDEMAKSERFYRPVENIPIDILNAPREEHSLMRRAMAHGFSDRSMREQQPIIKGYIDLLIQRLREISSRGEPADLGAWYNFTTFDVIGDLAFGER